MKIQTTKIYDFLRSWNDDQKCLIGRLYSELNQKKEIINSLEEVEFKVFSQWGDDGIIQYLINKIDIPQKIFIEFGVETYHESNTRFLLMNNNWKGLVIDGSEQNINSIKNQKIYWQHELYAFSSFITKENINEVISSSGIKGEIGILSVDIDGNDYWVLNEINVVNPIIIIVEYNAVFGDSSTFSVPYDPNFIRNNKHFSNLYWGASLGAFYHLLLKKGYSFIGCNSNGNNGYFVRNDKIGNLPLKGLEEGFVNSKFSESRDEKNRLTFTRGNKRIEIIKGLPIIDVTNNQEYLL